MKLYIDEREQRLRAGWNRFASHLGAHVWRDKLRFMAAAGCRQYIRVAFDDHEWRGNGYLLPRSILTIREESSSPLSGLLSPGEADYWRDGGGTYGINPCGEGDVLFHDGLFARCPVALPDMETGGVRQNVPVNGRYSCARGWHAPTTNLPDYSRRVGADIWDERRQPFNLPGVETDWDVARFLPHNDEHGVRSIRGAILNKEDPIVALDLAHLAEDYALAWSDAKVAEVRARPPAVGYSDCGRQLAWTGYIAAVAGHRPLASRIQAIVRHVQRTNGLLHRMVQGQVYPSPNPWENGVPAGTDVATDFECYAAIVMMEALNMKTEADKLARLVLTRPLKKWIDMNGQPVGNYWAAIDQAHAALAAWARIEPRAAREAMSRWPIPTAQGGQVGPFADTQDIVDALIAWGDVGKTRWALQFLTGRTT